MKHLTENTKIFVEKSSNEERILSTKKNRWIGYTHAISFLNKMEDCFNYPKSIRMPNLLIVGDSNNGKTALLHKFYNSHLAYLDEKTEKIINPIVYIQAPPEPDEKRFYNAILESLLAPTRTSEKIDSRQNRVINLFRELEVKVLMIDEIHHVLAGSATKQRLFLNVIKYLSNELKIPLICAGTTLAFNAIQSDSQLANRFEPRILRRWSNNNDYKRLLQSFEMMLPLEKESLLISDGIANKILAASDGLIGEIAKILELSSILAIESGTEKITANIIDGIDYIPPNKRKKTYFG